MYDWMVLNFNPQYGLQCSKDFGSYFFSCFLVRPAASSLICYCSLEQYCVISLTMSSRLPRFNLHSLRAHSFYTFHLWLILSRWRSALSLSSWSQVSFQDNMFFILKFNLENCCFHSCKVSESTLIHWKKHYQISAVLQPFVLVAISHWPLWFGLRSNG